MIALSSWGTPVLQLQENVEPRPQGWLDTSMLSWCCCFALDGRGSSYLNREAYRFDNDKAMLSNLAGTEESNATTASAILAT